MIKYGWNRLTTRSKTWMQRNPQQTLQIVWWKPKMNWFPVVSSLVLTIQGWLSDSWLSYIRPPSYQHHPFFSSLPRAITGWWFGTFCIFPYTGNSNPNWQLTVHIFQRSWNHQPDHVCFSPQTTGIHRSSKRSSLGRSWRRQHALSVAGAKIHPGLAQGPNFSWSGWWPWIPAGVNRRVWVIYSIYSFYIYIYVYVYTVLI